MRPVTVRLFVIPGSHPAMGARLMLEHKGIPYKRVDLIPVASKGILRAAGFPGVKVPALNLDGQKIQGSRDIARALDGAQPEPTLFPSDPDQRQAVEEAERWGDEVFQPAPRRIIWWLLKRSRAGMESLMEGARVGVPVSMAVKTAAPIAALSARFNESTDDNVRADLAALLGWIDHVDALIADGAIGGSEPNAADFQIAPSVRLFMTMEDLRPYFEGRPAAEFARRVCPDYPGSIPAALPADWLPAAPAAV